MAKLNLLKNIESIFFIGKVGTRKLYLITTNNILRALSSAYLLYKICSRSVKISRKF